MNNMYNQSPVEIKSNIQINILHFVEQKMYIIRIDIEILYKKYHTTYNFKANILYNKLLTYHATCHTDIDQVEVGGLSWMPTKYHEKYTALPLTF